MGCPWTTHVHAGPLFLGEHTPSKTKIKCIKEELKCKRDDLYLLGPSRSSFHPLKLPESTFLAKGFFSFWLIFKLQW
jgi:hypothetical protein